MRTPVTVGVVCGANGTGDELARMFDELPQATLRWICDAVRRPSSIGYGPATAWTMDLDELLQDEDLDAVAFAAPQLAEGGAALAALDAGKHVFVDGPLRSTAADADRLVTVAAAGNRRLLAQSRALLRPGVLHLRRLIDRGALGEIFYIRAARAVLGADPDVDVLHDLGLDLIGLTLDLLGDEPVEVTAYGESYLGRQRPDVVFATLRFATGIGVYLHLSCLDGNSGERVSVVGSEATAVLAAADAEQALSVVVGGAAPSLLGELPMGAGDRISFRRAPDDALRLGCSRFLTAIRSKGENPYGREASAALAVVEALEHSCRNRGAVEPVAPRAAGSAPNVVAFPTR